MYFKKLEIVGFKSFCDKTTLYFEPGVTAVVGPNGCGKCLSYDSLVTLDNGSKVQIGDLVEDALQRSSRVENLDDGLMTSENGDNVRVLSLNLESLKMETRPVYAFIKRKAPEYLLEIVTKSGKSVTTTHYHPFFSINNGQVIELKAEELKTGIRIAVPRQLPVTNASSRLDLWKILRKFGRNDLVYVPFSPELSDFISRIKMNDPDTAVVSNSAAVCKTVVSSVNSGQAVNIHNFIELLKAAGTAEIPDFVTHIKSRSCGKVRLPRRIDRSAARFLGYILSEGRTTSSNQVWFVNEDEKIVADYAACAREAFDVEAKVFNYKDCARDVLIFSSALCGLLDKAFDLKVNSVSSEKMVPAALFGSEKEVIGEFLSALFEGDGYISVNRKGSGTYFEYATASGQLAKGVSGLLLRLGVQSVIRKKYKAASNTPRRNKKAYYSVFVSGLDNVKLLAGLLNFVGAKSVKLDEVRTLDYKTNQNLDLIPEINGILKELVKLSGVKIKRFRKISPRLAAYYENRCFPTRQGLLEALSIVSEHGRISGLARSLYDYLKTIAVSDVYWDEVVGIKKVYSEKWVYDLSVLGNHNFVAEDIIVHNSNIFDSIRWVLGEQSVKALRGSAMEDVIFNGTEKREALGMAEVSLTFDNAQRFLPIDQDEVAITRRIFRSGESEYLINKAQARLKDILELLMGTGIGAESYSLVQQGKIDLVLSSKPEDRRLVFDEASGITKYKAQKKEALRKLDETEQNLLRVNDIVTEVRRQIGSLERQASKARRYREVYEELKTKELNFAFIEREALVKGKEEISARLASLEKEAVELAEAARLQEEQLSSGRRELDESEIRIQEIKAQIAAQENEISRNRQQIDFDRQRIKELEINEEYFKSQIEQSSSRLAADEEKLKSIETECGIIRAQIEEKTSALKEKEAALEAINSAVKSSLDKIAAAKSAVMGAASRVSSLKNAIAEMHSRQQVHVSRQKRLELERVKINEEIVNGEGSLSEVDAQLRILENDFARLNAEFSEVKSSNEVENASLDGLETELLGLEKELLSLESQKQFLEELKVKYEDIRESLNAVVFLDKNPEQHLGGMVLKIKDYLPMEESEKGQYPDSGVKLRCEAKPIDLDTRVINEKIGQTRLRIDGLKAAIQEKRACIAGLEARIASLQEGLKNQEIALANKRTFYDGISGQVNKVKEEAQLLLLELSEVEKEICVSREGSDRLSGELAEAESLQNESEAAIVSEQENIAEENARKEETLVVITRARTELEVLGKRVSAEEETLGAMRERYNQDSANLRELESQIHDAVSKRTALIEEIRELEKKVFSGQEAAELCRIDLRETEAGHSSRVSSVQTLERGLEENNKRRGGLKDSIYELQMRNQDVEFRISTVRERMLQSYKIDLDAVQSIPEDAPPVGEQTQPAVQSPEALKEDIQRLKDKLGSYGNVNLVAIEEYDELKKRYDFLSQQQTDLVNAKAALHEAILKINRTTRKMFLETFEKVKEEFKNFFRLLFNGGDAQVYLNDESDPLESGIEIVCRPPGKKLQNVLLLSGGEKSMAAIALIFAIFKVKPAPFCILDEIDAALDEANVDRYGRMLQEFSGISQFIVITHNKKTIANANVMYGITMQESGVSKIVSVKFSKDGKPPQEVTSQESPAQKSGQNEQQTVAA